MGQALNFVQKTAENADELDRLDAVLDRYYGFYASELDMGLGRILGVLDKIDNPHLKIDKPIHIAGTNGKGSTLAFLQAILEGEGECVNKTCSPHLVAFNERLYIGGDDIKTPDLIELLEGLEPLFEEYPVTFFEAVMVAIFKAFSENPCDFSLIETGMGGRLDASNVLAAPELTIITTISKDHQDYLGEHIEQIAREKAGIMKPNTPCIIGPQIYPEATSVLCTEAKKLNAPVFCAGQDWFIDHDQNGRALLIVESKHGWPIEEGVYALPDLPLIGSHQHGNAGTALIAAKIALSKKKQKHHDIQTLSGHLKQTVWPARMQDLSFHPFAQELPQDASLWLDGGHNDSAALALSAHMRNLKADKNTGIYLIVGMLEKKDAGDFLGPMAAVSDGIATIPVPSDWSGYKPDALLSLVPQSPQCEKLGAFDGVDLALRAVSEAINGNQYTENHVIICGSLYLAGAVLGGRQ